MSTNFYWLPDIEIPSEVRLPTGEVIRVSVDHDDPRVHIGSRAAAGLYCYDCSRSLCMAGESQVHRSHGFYDTCPSCGQGPPPSTMDEGPVAVELGFAAPATTRPKGVRGCSSFSWAQNPEQVLRVCNERPNDTIIEDEYGRKLMGREFTEMIDANCPIRFYDFIGRVFS